LTAATCCALLWRGSGHTSWTCVIIVMYGGDDDDDDVDDDAWGDD
jgi:hypothetical protein